MERNASKEKLNSAQQQRDLMKKIVEKGRAWLRKQADKEAANNQLDVIEEKNV